MERITYINHSSLLIESGGKTLLTDPWYFENAFHGWAPYPQPDAKQVYSFLEGRNQIDYVLISHAHDDHFDSVFLGRLCDSVTVCIPKEGGPGLRKRLYAAGISDSQIISVGKEPIQIEGFILSAIRSDCLSHEDFIFVISTEEQHIVHANDNWHPYSVDTAMQLQGLFAQEPSKLRSIFAQIGIADSYPIFYRGLSIEQKRNIMARKCRAMTEALIENGRRVGVTNLYAYANQSLFERQVDKAINPYDIRDSAIQASNQKVIQLLPQWSISTRGEIDVGGRYCPLIVERLRRLTNEYALYISKRNEVSGLQSFTIKNVVFRCSDIDDSEDEPENIYIDTSLHQWNRILCGAENLESVITGGYGEVSAPTSYNMRKEYCLLVDWAYTLQSSIRSGKLRI